MNKNFNKGITLVALIITIIVLAILATISIQAITGEGIFEKARETKFKAEMVQLQRDLGVYVAEKQVLYRNTFHAATLNASANGIIYETALGAEQQEGDIGTIFPSISKKRKEQIEIIKGEILFSSQNKNELKWAQELGISINPYYIVDGVLMSSDTNLMLMGEDGVLAIPTSVTKIADGAFASVKGIKKVIIPESVTEIGAYAFAYNHTLEEVIIKNGVKTIGNYAFYNCTSLTKVEMTDSVLSIGTTLFCGDAMLKEITLSNNITNLKSQTFSGCSNLLSIDLPEQLETIGGSSFSDCSQLTKLMIPKNVKSIDTSAFGGCSSLAEIEIDSNNKNFSAQDGIIYNYAKTNIIWIAPNAAAMKGSTFTVLDTVTELGSSLIDKFPNITKAVIPAKVTTLNMSFFTSYLTEVEIAEDNPNYKTINGSVYNKAGTILYKYIGKDETITIGEGVLKIDRMAFSLAGKAVKSINLPQSLTSVGERILINCTNVTSITFGPKVNDINRLFNTNSSLKTVTIEANNPYYKVVNNGLYAIESNTLVRMISNSSSFSVEEGTKIIGQYAFYFFGVKNVFLPNTVTTIEGLAFDSSSLSSIHIPSSVTSIGSNAFRRCSALQEITIDQKEGAIPGAPWGAPIGDRVKITWNG